MGTSPGEDKERRPYMDGFENNKPADIIIPPGQAETLSGNTKPSRNQKPSGRHKKRKQSSSTKFERIAEAGRWFQMICWLKIPVIGFIYMLGLAISRKTPEDKKNFILGYMLYKLLVWTLAIVIAYVLYKAGLRFIDGMLQYVS